MTMGKIETCIWNWENSFWIVQIHIHLCIASFFTSKFGLWHKKRCICKKSWKGLLIIDLTTVNCNGWMQSQRLVIIRTATSRSRLIKIVPKKRTAREKERQIIPSVFEKIWENKKKHKSVDIKVIKTKIYRCQAAQRILC